MISEKGKKVVSKKLGIPFAVITKMTSEELFKHIKENVIKGKLTISYSGGANVSDNN